MQVKLDFRKFFCDFSDFPGSHQIPVGVHRFKNHLIFKKQVKIRFSKKNCQIIMRFRLYCAISHKIMLSIFQNRSRARISASQRFYQLILLWRVKSKTEALFII